MEGITLKEVMKIEPFSRAVLMAGESSLEGLVTSANIQEVPEVGRWLHGGELLFTAGYAFRTKENGIRLLDTLKEKGVAGIAIKPGKYFPEIPKEMLEHADQIGFPLFALPQDLPYMDCILPIFEHITKSQLALIRRNEEIHEQLILVIVEGKGLAGICAILSQIAKGGVAVVSPKGLILAMDFQEGKEPEAEKSRYAAELMSYHFSASTVRKMWKNRCNTIYSFSGEALICIPVFVKEELLAYLVIKPEQGMEQQDMIAFENASTLIAVELLKEQEALNQERNIQEQLLDDLLAGRYSEADVMIRRGQFVGYDLHMPGCVFVMNVNSFEKFLSREHYTEEQSVQKIKNDMRTELEQRLHEARLSCLMMGSGMDVIGLVQMKSETDRDRLKRILELVIRRLHTLYRKLDLSAGIGQTKNNLTAVSESSQEARYAIRAGRSIKRQEQQSSTYDFEELGSLCFLCELVENQAMNEFYKEHMQELERYDKENNGMLLQTLETYFACGTNIRRTADALFMHKNSVIYRLSKIESIIGRTLEDPEVLFDLQLCLKLRQII